MTGDQLLAALAAGAAGVQLGTAFLTCDEAGTSPIGKEMLMQEHDRGTVMTQVRMFGRWAGSALHCSMYRGKAEFDSVHTCIHECKAQGWQRSLTNRTNWYQG